MEKHPEVLSQASRNSVIVRQNILEKVGHRQAANQIDVEQKAATSRLNDEMRKMRKSLLPSVDSDDRSSKKRPSLHRGATVQPKASFTSDHRSDHRSSLFLPQEQMSKRSEKRSNSDGAISGAVGGVHRASPASNGAPTTLSQLNRNSFAQGLPSIDNRSRLDQDFAPMTYWSLKQMKKEGDGIGDEKGRTQLDKDLEDRLKSFMVKSPHSPRSFSVDATTSAGQKSHHLWDHGPGGGGGRGGGQSRRGSNFATTPRKSGTNNSLTADAGLSAQEVRRLKKLAPKESIFFDEGDADDVFDGINSPRLNEIKESDSDDEDFPLTSLPPTKLPPIYMVKSKVIGNQKTTDENPVRQNMRSTLPSPDWDSMKNTRYLRPKAKRIQEWYDYQSKHGPR